MSCVFMTTSTSAEVHHCVIVVPGLAKAWRPRRLLQAVSSIPFSIILGLARMPRFGQQGVLQSCILLGGQQHLC